jgi:hypothetical protein
MKMRITSNPYLTASVAERIEVSSSPKNTIQKQQMIHRLKWLTNENYQLMVKTKILTNTLKKPAFKDLIEIADYVSDKIMIALNHYVFHIKNLETTAITLPSLVQSCEVKQYAGWVDRVKEMIQIHLNVRSHLLETIVLFQESDFQEIVHFLKEQIVFHEDELWHLRNQIDG